MDKDLESDIHFRRELLSCSGCRYVKYCDKSCQKSAWSYHKNECINLRKLPSGKEVPNTARLLLRLITKLKVFTYFLINSLI